MFKIPLHGKLNSMYRKLLTAFALFLTVAISAQITVTNAIVPHYIQGVNGTNNNRTPFYFWAELSGLTPNATYRFYTGMDTLGSSNTSNGAGNSLLINNTTGDFRRTTNVSLSNVAGHDSLTADSSGRFSGWFGVESTGNGRYTPGMMVHPQLNMNNGAGGTSVANRVKLTAYMVRVVNYGTNSGNQNQCSFLFDRADSVTIAQKSIVLLYDSVSGNGRPISSAVVELEGINQNVITSTVAAYRDSVDLFTYRWGTINPNSNTNGVRRVEYRDLLTDTIINAETDGDGWWCSGVNTVSPSNGNIPVKLNEYFTLGSTANIPDTAYTTIPAFFTAASNDPVAYYAWDFGDNSVIGTTSSTSHTYTTTGTYVVTLVINNGACYDTITQNIVVLLGTGIAAPQPGLWFTVAPNPSNGQVSVNIRQAGERTVTIFNMLGEVVQSRQFMGTQAEFDLSSMPKGIYMIHVTDDATGKTGVHRVVIQ
jgi:PKD repeat protein